MGCSESSRANASFFVNLDEAYFNKSQIKLKKPLSTKLCELSREIICQNLKEGISTSNLKIQINHRQCLFDSNNYVPLFEIGLTSGDSLSLQVTEDLSEKITLSFMICENTKKVLRASLPKNEKISNLRKRFCGTADCQNKVKILYKDIELDDNNTLSDCGVEQSELITVVINDNNCSRRDSVVPHWKIKKSGLVLEGICMNHQCVAYKQRVCICLGMGKFDAVLEMSDGREHKCPVCNQDIYRANKFGFVMCNYKFCGILEDGTISNESRNIKGYNEFPEANLNWRELKIEVSATDSNVCLNN